jgi:GGDEF domain-containing protein
LIEREVHCAGVLIDNRDLIYCLARDITAIKQSLQRAEHLAFHHALTGLPNRLLVADRMSQALSLAERNGSDEFVLLLSVQEDMEASSAVLERVCAELARPVVIDRYTDARVSASIGVATFPADGESADLLLSCADSAMYQAKKQRDQRICHYGHLGGSSAPRLA